ncbi:MAG: hypothetical protein NTV86_11140 [Planctomycetota bacterium]|nr:hypothetical protein [Planctomycetota bacterium]
MDSPISRPSEEPLSDVSRFLWLGVPLLSLAIVLLAPLMGYKAWDKYFMMSADWHSKEFGFIEVVPLFFLAGATVLGVVLFLRRQRLPARVGAVMLLAALAAFFFLGEECSWGQHYLGYKTPAGMTDLNRQHEFNLHNNRGAWKTIFSTIPRLAATVVMCAMAVGPFLLRRRPDLQRVDSPWYWVLPTPAMCLVSAMAALSTLPAAVINMKSLKPYFPKDAYLSMALSKPSGEFKEYLVALAMLLYLASVYTRLRCRIRREAARAGAADTAEMETPA